MKLFRVIALSSLLFMNFAANPVFAGDQKESKCQKEIKEVSKAYPGQKEAFLKQSKLLSRAEAIKHGYADSDLRIEIDSANYVCTDSGLKEWSASVKAGNAHSYIILVAAFNPFTNEFISINEWESDGH